MAKILEGLYYSESHEYVRVDGDFGYIGITDYAQHALGNVVYVDVPDVRTGLSRWKSRTRANSTTSWMPRHTLPSVTSNLLFLISCLSIFRIQRMT